MASSASTQLPCLTGAKWRHVRVFILDLICSSCVEALVLRGAGMYSVASLAKIAPLFSMNQHIQGSIMDFLYPLLHISVLQTFGAFKAFTRALLFRMIAVLLHYWPIGASLHIHGSWGLCMPLPSFLKEHCLLHMRACTSATFLACTNKSTNIRLIEMRLIWAN